MTSTSYSKCRADRRDAGCPEPQGRTGDEVPATPGRCALALDRRAQLSGLGQSGGAKLRFPAPGETFAPADFGWGVFDAVEAANDIGDGPKRVMVRLMRLARDRSWCQTSVVWLARALGKSRRQVWAAIAVLAGRAKPLEGGPYIRHELRGCRGTLFRFLWRPEYERFLTDGEQTVQDSAQFPKVCGFPHLKCADFGIGIVRDFAQFTPPLYPPKNRINTRTESAHAENTQDAEAPSVSELFERLWKRHPKKRGRYLAEQALAEVLAEAPDPATLARRIEQVHAAWSGSPEWRREGGRFAPQLHRWLLDRGWLDGPPAGEEQPVPYRPYWEVAT